MKTPPDEVKRFGILFRLQHGILLSSVALAVVTGLPMKYPDPWLSRAIVALLGGVEMRALLHHIAGWVMMLLGLFHLVYYTVADRKTPLLKKAIMLGPKDISDFVHHQRYNLGKAPDLPKMGRYTWFEKFDYVGVLWGIGVMGVTGMLMLYMDIALKVMPLSWLQVLWAAHSEEAMLATLFLFVIHMYNTHFSPERFPMSLAWLTGTISREDQQKYHPLEDPPPPPAQKRKNDTMARLRQLLAAINRRFGAVGAVVSVAFWLTVLVYAFITILADLL